MSESTRRPKAPASAPDERSTEATPGVGAAAPPSVSVVICAYTEARWQQTRDAVASVRAQSQPPLETLLVIDHHPALHAAFTAEYAHTPGVRVLENAGPRGLSAGRNTGIAAAAGEVVAFLDDDAVAERAWLHHLTAPYRDPAVFAVGGRTEPIWATGRRPPWFPAEFDWTVGCMYRGHPTGRVRVRNVLGGNASFRRAAFEVAGGFATGIGRGGGALPDGTQAPEGAEAEVAGGALPLGCEETELCIRLTAARPDAVLLVDDAAVIHHHVPADRARLGYLRRRAYAEGVSKAMVAQRVGARDGLATERRYVTRALPSGAARGVRDALLGRPGGAGRFGALVTGVAAAAVGYLVGEVRHRRERRVAGGTAPVGADTAANSPSSRVRSGTEAPGSEPSVQLTSPPNGGRSTYTGRGTEGPRHLNSQLGTAPVEFTSDRTQNTFPDEPAPHAHPRPAEEVP